MGKKMAFSFTNMTNMLVLSVEFFQDIENRAELPEWREIRARFAWTIFSWLITNSAKALLGQEQVNIWESTFYISIFSHWDLISSGS